MAQKALSKKDVQRTSPSTKPSLLENRAVGKGISTVNSSIASGATPFSNGKPKSDGLTGKSQISTISLGDHGKLYCGMRPICRIRPTSAVLQGGSVGHINRLQGELVRKRKVSGSPSIHHVCAKVTGFKTYSNM